MNYIRQIVVACTVILVLSGIAFRWGVTAAEEEPVYVTVTPVEAGNDPSRVMAATDLKPPVDRQGAAVVDTDIADSEPKAKSMGQVMVLMYHLFGPENTELQRTPESFRSDLERLLEQGYTPVNLIDLTNGLPNLKPGQKPVVLTFDDSHISQFRLLEDGTTDPDSGVGVLYQFHQENPEAWPLKGTFYVLLDNGLDGTLFGQDDTAHQKLAWLVDQGFEIGSHTVTHLDLGVSNGYQVVEELARSQRELEAILIGYDVQSFAIPYGSLPLNEDYLSAGYYDGKWYTYANNVMAWGGPAASPHSDEFNPFRIPRISVTDAEFDYWFTYFEQHPDEYYQQP